MFFTIYGHGGHLGRVTRTIWTNFLSPILRSLHMKFEFNWHSGFRGEDVWKCWRTDDGRTTEGRLSPWYTNSSPRSLQLRWAKNHKGWAYARELHSVVWINSLPPAFFVACWFFSKLTFFEKLFQEYHLSVKQIGSRSGPMFCQALSGSKFFAKVMSRWHLSRQRVKQAAKFVMSAPNLRWVFRGKEFLFSSFLPVWVGAKLQL